MRVVLPAPEGAERMKSSPRCMQTPRGELGGTRAPDRNTKQLFDVLYLLPGLLAQHLGVENRAGHFGVAALGAEGVQLAEDLLGEEVEPLAGGAGVAGDGEEMLQVGTQPVDLLAAVAAVGQQRPLLGEGRRAL